MFNHKRLYLFCYLTLVLISVSLFSSCTQKPGTLTGNVFWKYNNYVGDKPDAGAEVYLFPSDTTKDVLSATCDVQGNYKFENIPSGKYLLVIKSKNTNSNGDDNYDYLKFHQAETEKYFGFNIQKINPSLNDSIVSLRRARDTLMFKIGKSIKEIQSSGLSIFRVKDAIERLLQEIPNNERYEYTYIKYPQLSKTKIKEIEIKPTETTNIVTDFGATYQ